MSIGVLAGIWRFGELNIKHSALLCGIKINAVDVISIKYCTTVCIDCGKAVGELIFTI